MSYEMSIDLNTATFADLAIFMNDAEENGADPHEELTIRDGRLTVTISTTAEDHIAENPWLYDTGADEDVVIPEEFMDTPSSPLSSPLRGLFDSFGVTESTSRLSDELSRLSDVGREFVRELRTDLDNAASASKHGDHSAFRDFDASNFDERLKATNFDDSADEPETPDTQDDRDKEQ